MPNNRQMFRRSLGEVMADMVRRRFASAKAIAGQWKVGVPTAENTRKGVSSVTAFEAAMDAEGWDFLSAFGREYLGQSFEEWQQQKLNQILEEVARVESNVERLRTRQQTLDEQTDRLLRAVGGEGAPEHRVR